MAFEIEWTKRADKEFDDIIEFLAKEWSYRVKVVLLKIFIITLFDTRQNPEKLKF